MKFIILAIALTTAIAVCFVSVDYQSSHWDWFCTCQLLSVFWLVCAFWVTVGLLPTACSLLFKGNRDDG